MKPSSLWIRLIIFHIIGIYRGRYIRMIISSQIDTSVFCANGCHELVIVFESGCDRGSNSKSMDFVRSVLRYLMFAGLLDLRYFLCAPSSWKGLKPLYEYDIEYFDFSDIATCFGLQKIVLWHNVHFGLGRGSFVHPIAWNRSRFTMHYLHPITLVAISDLRRLWYSCVIIHCCFTFISMMNF